MPYIYAVFQICSHIRYSFTDHKVKNVAESLGYKDTKYAINKHTDVGGKVVLGRGKSPPRIFEGVREYP